MQMKTPRFQLAHRGCLFLLQSAHTLFPSSLTKAFRVCAFFAALSASGRRDIEGVGVWCLKRGVVDECEVRMELGTQTFDFDTPSEREEAISENGSVVGDNGMFGTRYSQTSVNFTVKST